MPTPSHNPSAASRAARASVASFLAGGPSPAAAFPGAFSAGGTLAMPLPNGYLAVLDCTAEGVSVDLYPPGGEGEPVDSCRAAFAPVPDDNDNDAAIADATAEAVAARDAADEATLNAHEAAMRATNAANDAEDAARALDDLIHNR